MMLHGLDCRGNGGETLKGWVVMTEGGVKGEVRLFVLPYPDSLGSVS
jgi:hypothetical protein